VVSTFSVTHLKGRCTSCSSVLVCILSSFGLFLDSDSCSRIMSDITGKIPFDWQRLHKCLCCRLPK